MEIISKQRVQNEAKSAFESGKSLNDTCPYPFASDAGKLFKSTYNNHAQASVSDNSKNKRVCERSDIQDKSSCETCRY